MEDIDILREIKEKIRKNPRYICPCSQEFKNDIKKYGFDSGKEYIFWMRQNRILPNINIITKKYNDNKAQLKGYKNDSEYQKVELQEYKNLWNRNYRHENGIQESMDSNEDCASYLGVFIGENKFKEYLLTIFEYVKKMDYGSPGFDFICKDPRQEFVDKHLQFKLERNKEYKIQLKVRCLRERNGSIYWIYCIDYNSKPDYFLLVAYDNRNNQNVLCLWLFHKDDIIRGRPFWNRSSLTMTNKSEYLVEFHNNKIDMNTEI